MQNTPVQGDAQPVVWLKLDSAFTRTSLVTTIVNPSGVNSQQKGWGGGGGGGGGNEGERTGMPQAQQSQSHA